MNSINKSLTGQEQNRGKYINEDPSWDRMIRTGGLFLAIAGIIAIIYVLLVFGLNVTIPLQPQGILENPQITTYLFMFVTFGELFLMPGVIGLYYALRNKSKTQMTIATALWILCVPFFLISRALIISLYPLSSSYLSANSEAVKTAYLATAELALEVEHILSTMALICLNVATIIIGRLMLKGGFGKRISYVVIASGIFTLFTPFGVLIEIPLIIPFTGLILTSYWQTSVGLKLYRLNNVQLPIEVE
jgi:hypothetical protein